MINTTDLESRLRAQRMDAKSLESLFRRRIEEGANCAPFVSNAIFREACEVFDLDGHGGTRELSLGQVRFLAVSAHEPAGKTLDDCEKVCVLLTLDAGKDDAEIRYCQSVTGLRRAKILRLVTEAKDQGGLLSYEDLAYRLLNCGYRTVVRDCNALRTEGISVPTRGQQHDMGPRQTHRVQAVELYLRGYESKEIARRLYHSLSSIENYVQTFGRIVLLLNRDYTDDEMAFLVRRSSVLVKAYRQLYEQYRHQVSAQRRLEEIVERVQSSKKGGQA